MGGIAAFALALAAGLSAAPDLLAHPQPSPRQRAEASSQPERYDWVATWRALDRLRELPPGSERFQALWSDLDATGGARERDSRTLRDRAATFRARLLRAELAALAGRPPRTIADPGVEIEFRAGEAWLAACHLASCPLRVRAFREALAQSQGELRRSRRDRALKAVDEDLRAARVGTAEALARVLIESSPDAESMVGLAQVLRLDGRAEEADRLLDAAFAGRIEPSQRAQLALERGRIQRALRRDTSAARWLGAALSEGSVDAALCLAQTALSDGDSDSARTVFRALLDADPAPAGAWRGWGLSQLAARGSERGNAHTNLGNP